MVDTVLQVANANNTWSAQQAQKQMDFQREMSNTAHQREIADLKAAGLNPVLSARLGGASTPTGAMGDTDTSVTGAIIDAMSNMAQGMAFGYASGSARSNASGDGSFNDYLHVLADLLPYRWRKGAHGAINLLGEKTSGSSLGDLVSGESRSFWDSKLGKGLNNVHKYVSSQPDGFWNWQSYKSWKSEKDRTAKASHKSGKF